MKSQIYFVLVASALVYPVADMTGAPAPSVAENADAKPLNKPMLDGFTKHRVRKVTLPGLYI